MARVHRKHQSMRSASPCEVKVRNSDSNLAGRTYSQLRSPPQSQPRFRNIAIKPLEYDNGKPADDQPGEGVAQVVPADEKRANAHSNVYGNCERKQDGHPSEQIS